MSKDRLIYYKSYVSDRLLHLLKSSSPSTVPGIPDLLVCRSSDDDAAGSTYETEALPFVCELYDRVRPALETVLERRISDRRWIDEQTRVLAARNSRLGRTPSDPDFESVLGISDPTGRVVVGPYRCSGSVVDYRTATPGARPIAPLPPFLQGAHVTLFGPADNPRMCVNALNSIHRALPGEPSVVARLVQESKLAPKWGADDEDSKTPLRGPLLSAMANLGRCFDGTIRADGVKLADSRRAHPIKRVPGLAIPSTSLIYRGDVIPLHLYDLAMHLFHLWDRPEALTFYIPKMENDEEAAYWSHMISTAENLLREKYRPSYVLGTVRVLVVLESARAVFRVNEIIDALYPYFAGASLGWHDYVATAARLFREDNSYRIPCKADPHIVVRHIKESHVLLSRIVTPRGGISIGGMYGVLPLERQLPSRTMQATLAGYVRDVVVQMKRGLDGFWVAHPDFVRIGIALVEAFSRHTKDGGSSLEELIRALIIDNNEANKLVDLARNEDPVPSLDPRDPLYPRALLAAELAGASATIQNNDPEEVRYNVFQALQYLADWLRGNGCVALPATVSGAPVRVMDDLATTERSRWEVWHELRHGRFELIDVVRIMREELLFIKRGRKDEKTGKEAHVRFDANTTKWYPVAHRILLQLMCELNEPAEFAPELLMNFTVPQIRSSADPWHAASQIDPDRYTLPPRVELLDRLFEACGCQRAVLAAAEGNLSLSPPLSDAELREAVEQLSIYNNSPPPSSATTEELRKFFNERLDRANKHGVLDHDSLDIEGQLGRFGVKGVSIAILRPSSSAKDALPNVLTVAGGQATADGKKMTPDVWLQVASLSKPIGTAFALDYFEKKGFSFDSRVNEMLQQCGSPFRLRAAAGADPKWADNIQLQHLVSHSALGQPYVFGVPINKTPSTIDLLRGYDTPTGRYEPLEVRKAPDTRFGYSGGGFILLQHLIEQFEGGRSIDSIFRPWLDALGIHDMTLPPLGPSARAIPPNAVFADGFYDDDSVVEPLAFPALGAGGVGTARSLAQFLSHLILAYQRVEGSGPISHDTAVLMLGQPRRQVAEGARDFMLADIGLGIFICECGENRLALHQAANDGYRGVFVVCYDGPDAGRGFVVLANGDINGVRLISSICRSLLEHQPLVGVDLNLLPPLSSFTADGIPQETVVNQGYKALLFQAFLPDLPPCYPREGVPHHPLAAYDLAIGARLLRVTDQKFAQAINLVDPTEPQYDPAAFTHSGKQMDSWETQRHNPLASDVAEFALATPARIRYVEVSTKWHDGNQALAVKVVGRFVSNGSWRRLVSKSSLKGHSYHRFVVNADAREPVDQIRIHNFPDGGISRLRLYGDSLPDQYAKLFPSRGHYSDLIPSVARATTLVSTSSPYPPQDTIVRNWHRLPFGKEADIASITLGGRIIDCSNQHFGPADAILQPHSPRGMFDGFETRRARDPGHSEYVTVHLGVPARITRIVIDMTYFVNNNPRSLAIEALDGSVWHSIVPERYVKPYRGNVLEIRLRDVIPFVVHQVRVLAYPCGGFNRLHVFAVVDKNLKQIAAKIINKL